MSLLNHSNKKKSMIWVAVFSLALCFFYSLFYLAKYLGLSFLVLTNRGMIEQTVGGSILSGFWDPVVWGVAIIVVLVWLVYVLRSKMVEGEKSFVVGLLVGLCGLGVCLVVLGFVGVWSLVLISGLLLGLGFVFAFDLFGVGRLGFSLRVLFGLLLLVLFVEVASFVLFNVPIVLGFEVGVLGLHWGGVELVFANLTYPFLPYVYLLFVLFGVGVYIFRVFPKGWVWFVGKVRGGWFVSGLNSLFLGVQDGSGFLQGRFVVLAVVVSSVVSCLFVLFTVLPWNNPTNMLVSVDSGDYFKWISYMRSVDVNSALSFAFGNDRALFLVLCYILSFFISIINVVQFVAALLIVLFGVVSLLVLRLFSKNRVVWVFGVLLVPFSFQSLGLIYSGYFANMLALILIFVYIVLFFRVVVSQTIFGFLSLLVVSILVLFSHSWTWFIFAVSLCLFLFLQWRSATRDRGLWTRFKTQALFVGASVGVGLLSDLMRKLLSPVSSTASVAATVQSSIGLPNPAFLLSGMRQAVEVTLGGVFGSGLLVFLSVVGFFVLLRFKSEVSSFFVAWICVGCVSILFAADDFVFNRFLFMLPWVVLSGLGLAGVVWFVCSKFGGFGGRRLWLIGVMLVFVFLMLLNGSLRYLFNINIW